MHAESKVVKVVQGKVYEMEVTMSGVVKRRKAPRKVGAKSAGAGLVPSYEHFRQ